MTTYKNLYHLIANAGLENLASFAENVMMMFEQELDAIRSAAMHGAAAVIQCPNCGEYITGRRQIICRLYLYDNDGKEPPRLFLDLNCPNPDCDQAISIHIVPGEIDMVPF